LKFDNNKKNSGTALLWNKNNNNDATCVHRQGETTGVFSNRWLYISYKQPDTQWGDSKSCNTNLLWGIV